MSVALKRAYDQPSADDGYRVLVDRLWPRGVSKGKARLDEWAEHLAPSTELRREFHEDVYGFDQFSSFYIEELRQLEPELAELRERAKSSKVTLVFGAKDVERNHACVLAAVLEAEPKA